jgi:peptidoglycan/LPS O-acetylase OafA/YrhL
VKKPEPFHSKIIPDTKLLQGILGLRGVAALAVLLFHLSRLTGIHVPVGFYFIEQEFGAGPHLFFVLSAFSLMYSTEHTMYRPNWTKEYLIKRFFRIAPLFYTMLFLMLIWNFSHFPSITIILLNVFFVFGFFLDPETGLVWAGWTVGVEMIFYVLLPILLMTIRTKTESLIFLSTTVLISYFSGIELHNLYLNTTPLPKWDWSGFAFLPNLFFFAVGIYAYRLEQFRKSNGRALHFLIPLLAILAVGLHSQSIFGSMGVLIQAAGFGALCVWQSAKPNIWFANKFYEYLGERSFSIYLLHPLVIILSKGYVVSLYAKLEPEMGAYAYFICALLVAGEVLVMAEITYRIIEVPGIRFGRNIIVKMQGVTP